MQPSEGMWPYQSLDFRLAASEMHKNKFLLF